MDGLVSAASPTTYSNPGCFKAYIVDVNNWDTGNTETIFMEWADAKPTTQSACQNAWMSWITYQQVNGAWIQIGKQKSQFGSWSGSSCGLRFDWTSELFIDGNSYRFAGTARTSYAGSTTRSIAIQPNDG